MDSKRKIISTAALVAFLVACGGGGGAKALADVTDAMFNALSARVTANESSIQALQNAPGPANVVDVNGTVVGPVVGRGNGGTALVDIVVNGIDYVTTFGPGGTWRPKQTYHTEPTCNLTASLFVDQREIESGFWFLWSPSLTSTSQAGWFDLVPVDGDVIPGWVRDGFGSCTGIQNPRLKLYTSHFVGTSDVFIAPFTIE